MINWHWFFPLSMYAHACLCVYESSNMKWHILHYLPSHTTILFYAIQYGLINWHWFIDSAANARNSTKQNNFTSVILITDVEYFEFYDGSLPTQCSMGLHSTTAHCSPDVKCCKFYISYHNNRCRMVCIWTILLRFEQQPM